MEWDRGGWSAIDDWSVVSGWTYCIGAMVVRHRYHDIPVQCSRGGPVYTNASHSGRYNQIPTADLMAAVLY